MSTKCYRETNISLKFHYPGTKVYLYAVVTLLTSYDHGTNLRVYLYTVITLLTSYDTGTNLRVYLYAKLHDYATRVDLYSALTPIIP